MVVFSAPDLKDQGYQCHRIMTYWEIPSVQNLLDYKDGTDIRIIQQPYSGTCNQQQGTCTPATSNQQRATTPHEPSFCCTCFRITTSNQQPATSNVQLHQINLPSSAPAIAPQNEYPVISNVHRIHLITHTSFSFTVRQIEPVVMCMYGGTCTTISTGVLPESCVLQISSVYSPIKVCFIA